MKSTLRTTGIGAALAAALALAACGGNSHDTPVTEEVPSSASASVDGFIEYLMKLVEASADMLEPVDVAAVVAPTDDTAEPRPLP